MERVFSNLSGYMVWEKGDDKHVPTHVVMSAEEYKSIVETKRLLKEQIDSLKEVHASEMNALKEKAINYKKKTDKAASEKVAEAKKKVKTAEEEAERQRNLNQNLLRISRERANAERGLQPKKTHKGYRCIGRITQTKVLGEYDRTTHKASYAYVWESTLETPYDGTISIDQIEDRIISDLIGPDGILKMLHVEYCTYDDGLTVIWRGPYYEVVDNADNKNYLFDYRFALNIKNKLWEVQIMTTKPIYTPPEMLI